MSANMKIDDLDELQAAYAEGAISTDTKLVIDNDSASLWIESVCVFEMHPTELLEQALAMLGIPNEPA